MPFLIRPRLLTGESISSWRQRSGMANYFNIYPLHDEPRRTDPDICSLAALGWLGKSFAAGVEELAGACLPSLTSRLTSRIPPARGTWVTAMRYTSRRPGAGAVYCPQCLADDKTEHFRLHWRLAFITECEVHGCVLLDACPECKRQVWPQCATQPNLYSAEALCLSDCPHCGFKLSRAPTQQSSSQTARRLLKALATGTCEVGSDLALPAGEFFDALRTLCHLFIRERPSQAIKKSNGLFGEVCTPAREYRAKQIELVEVRRRSAIVGTANELLTDWPRRFEDFCRDCGVSRQHFSDVASDAPTWLLRFVSKNLALQRRGISGARVQEVISALEASATPVTKVAVRNQLGCYGPAFIDTLLARRATANSDELALLISRLIEAAGKSSRPSTIYVVARDTAVLGTSILAGRPVPEVGAMTTEQIDSLLCRAGKLSVEGTQLRELAAGSLHLARRHIRYLDGRSSQGRFQGVRGGFDTGRAVRQLLSGAMLGFDRRLLRSSRVFHEACHSSSL